MNEIEMRRRSGTGTPVRSVENGDLPEHRQKQVEAGLAQYQAILAEREDLARKLADASITIDTQRKQLDALQGIINMLESTVQTHQLHRDDAVVKAARLSTILDSIAVMIRNEDFDGKAEGDVPRD